jgi:glycerol-3-phosphate dehydrogenase subunit B
VRTVQSTHHFDVIVAGAGIAGLTSAAIAASRGLRVALASNGPGTFVFGAGCVELQNVDRNAPGLEDAIDFFSQLTELAGCSFCGRIGETRYIPTILGSFQKVSLAPFYLWNGDPVEASEVAVVGIRGLSSFDANFVAERLAYHAGKMDRGSRYVSYEISLSIAAETVPGTLQFANRYDREPRFRHELRDALKPIADKVGVIILPGILGLKSGHNEIEWLQRELDCKLCELPTLPPSIPGMRLYNRLESRLRNIGVEFFTGFPIQQLELNAGRCTGLFLDTPARPMHLSAENVILATGPFSGKLLGSSFHGFNRELLPVDSTGAVLADNLFGAGAILHNSSERGGNAMAILTGYTGGMRATGAGVQYAQR